MNLLARRHDMALARALSIFSGVRRAPRTGIKSITPFAGRFRRDTQGRLLLRFSLYSGLTAGRLASTSALGVGDCFGIGVGPYIGGDQFVLALPASFQVGGQFVS